MKIKNNKQNWDGKIVIATATRGYMSGLILRGRYFRVDANRFDLFVADRGMIRFAVADTSVSLAEEASAE